MAKLYPAVLPWELEPYYSAHVVAMVREKLHSKSAIAEQLAVRDKEIASLRAALAERAVVRRLQDDRDDRDRQIAELREALRAARGEIARMAADGGGFSCSVIDEIDRVYAATEKKGP